MLLVTSLLPLFASAVPFVAPDPPGPHVALTRDDLRPATAWADDAPVVGT